MFGLTDRVGRASMRAMSIAVLGLATFLPGTLSAQAETRVLKFYHLHTHEKVSIAYKKDGRYIPDGLKKVNWELRDWRRTEPTKMDPRLLDLIWEAYRQSGSSEYINVVCGYRAPATNSMLRSRSSGVAKESQHMLGRALDFYIPGVPLKKMREIGLKMQVGGVGYYPRSGSPFVHFDVGNARHWPRMSRKELLAVFPNGGTVHVPSDGKPLPGYAEALASYKKRKGDSSIQVANAGASSGSTRSGGGKTLFAVLFGGGGGADEEEDIADVEVAAKTPAPAPAAKKVERPAPVPQEAVAVAALVPTAKPKLLAPGVPLPIRDAFDVSAPVPSVGLKPAAAVAAETQVASLEMSRIPLPRWAPQRAALPAVPVPSAPVVAENDDVATLVASIASSPEAEEIADGAAGQLAYSVPTPHNRPPFESILNNQSPTPASIDEIKRMVEANGVVASPATPAAEPASSTAPAMLAAAFPSARPDMTGSVRQPSSALVASIVLPSQRPAPDARKPSPNLLLASFQPPRAAVPAPPRWDVPAGKTGRFSRKSSAPHSQPAAAALSPKPQASTGRQVEVASLVDPNTRTEIAAMRKPNADRLVRDVPTAVFTAGFAKQPFAGAPDRFFGSAVNFLPVAKFD